MKLSPTKNPANNNSQHNSRHPLLGQTFSITSERLPTNAQIKDHIYTDRQWIEAGKYDHHKHQTTIAVRESYVGQSFVLLSDEFMTALQHLCTGFSNIVEICAGIGWLSHWLNKYGDKTITSIDNKSWPDFPPDRYLDIVQQMDSLDYLRHHPEVELFILAWPQDDNLATRLWQTLQTDQHLLYIGEDRGGCTANNAFFDLILGQEVQNNATKEMRQSFLSFDDFHDHPKLYKKS